MILLSLMLITVCISACTSAPFSDERQEAQGAEGVHEAESVQGAEGVQRAEGVQGSEAAQEVLPVGTAKQKDCLLCGDNSLLNDYIGFDSIGIFNLTNGHMNDIEILAYEEDGSPRDNTGYVSMQDSGDDDGCRYHLMTMGDRGICEMSLSWDKRKDLELQSIAPLYCKDCMEKITAMDGERADDCAKIRRSPFALIDFTDGQLYSLNGIVSACFIRDYYMNLTFDERRIEGVIFYAPKRSFGLQN